MRTFKPSVEILNWFPKFKNIFFTAMFVFQFSQNDCIYWDTITFRRWKSNFLFLMLWATFFRFSGAFKKNLARYPFVLQEPCKITIFCKNLACKILQDNHLVSPGAVLSIFSPKTEQVSSLIRVSIFEAIPVHIPGNCWLRKSTFP